MQSLSFNMYVCACVLVCTPECGCAWRPEEGVGASIVRVAGSCAPRDMAVSNQTGSSP